MMRTLRLRNIGWCEAHGHPVATLAADGDSAFVGIAISIADAQAMSVASVANAQPLSGEPLPQNTRLYALIELIASGLGGRLAAIELAVGRDRIVRSWLRLDGPLGSCSVPAAFSDALVLSQRLPLPLRMEAESFERLMGGSDTSAAPNSAAPCDAPVLADGLQAFRGLIDELDLDGLG